MLLGQALQILADTPAEEPLRVAVVYQRSSEYVEEVCQEMRVFKTSGLYSSFFKMDNEASISYIINAVGSYYDIIILLEQTDDLDYFRRRFQKYFKRHEYELMTEIH